jgi:hypothetical protein
MNSQLPLWHEPKSVRERDTMPSARDMSSDEMILAARLRGEGHGFTGQFLDHFIEKELEMMWKWNRRVV